MKISVVIVNYNVRNFLEQCLHSVFEACKGIDHEVFVVDNHSLDGSQAMVKSTFPEARLIENKKNLGFSKANNLALKMAQGQYQLVLNPDTLLEENTLRKCIDFMDAHPEAGALGVKMIDGRGKFLPESKRSLPTPATAFYKMFGLAALFPRSKRFGKYHLGYLPENGIHQVEVLSGAFMFLRKEALNKAGLFDEDYFMYGEDIDLSYRLLKHGYKNYYFPGTTIIHYKGESTKKSSINYVKTFYGAMLVFIRKHFAHKENSLFYLLIKLAVYLRGFISVSKRLGARCFLPVTDALLIYTGLLAMTLLWENIRFSGEYFYPPLLKQVIFPFYVALWMTGLFLAGAYLRSSNLRNSILGILFGTAAILILYSLLPIHLRFSRALILLGTASSMVATALSRVTASLLRISEFYLFQQPVARIVFVGYPQDSSRALSILDSIGQPYVFAGNAYDKKKAPEPGWLGNMADLEEIIAINRVNEIIFSSGNLGLSQIIECMNQLNKKNIRFRILSADGKTIMGVNPGRKEMLSLGTG